MCKFSKRKKKFSKNNYKNSTYTKFKVKEKKNNTDKRTIEMRRIWCMLNKKKIYYKCMLHIKCSLKIL